jgi:hypothetical protein
LNFGAAAVCEYARLEQNKTKNKIKIEAFAVENFLFMFLQV